MKAYTSVVALLIATAYAAETEAKAESEEWSRAAALLGHDTKIERTPIEVAKCAVDNDSHVYRCPTG